MQPGFGQIFNWAHAEDENGVPYLTEQTVAQYSCRVVGKLDAGTHMVFLGEVQEASSAREEDAMTYANYHLVKKASLLPKLPATGRNPLSKATAAKSADTFWNQTLLPEDFICPICKRGSKLSSLSQLSRICS